MAPGRYRLEPEWVAVLLAALVYNGDVTLSITGRKFDATSLDTLVTTPVADLVAFKHIEQPKDWNLPALRALFETLGLTPGLAQLVTQGKDEPVQQLQQSVARAVEAVVLARQQLADGIPFWGRPLLSGEEQAAYRARLDGVKAFLEGLQPYSSPGKLKNLRYDEDDVRTQAAGLATLREITTLQELAKSLGDTAAYLAAAELVLPADHPWVERVRGAREALLVRLTSPQDRAAPHFRQRAAQTLHELKSEYVTTYLSLHKRVRLGLEDDRRKGALVRDERLEQLRQLATIDLLPASQLAAFQERLAALRTCYPLTEQELQATPICPRCGYKPTSETTGLPADFALTMLDDELDRLLATWSGTLLENLDDPTARASIELLTPRRREDVRIFLKERVLPESLDADFIGAVQEALSGLAKVVVRAEDLRTALTNGGAPATPAELNRRFEEYLAGLARGQDPAKVRIVVE